MKIAYCLHSVKRAGGIERVVVGKANYWAGHGHEVHLITTDQGESKISFELNEHVKMHDLGLNYEADNQLGRWGRVRALHAKRSVHRERLDSLLTSLRCDIVVSTFFQEAPILPTIQDGSRKVLELHSSMYRRVFMYPKSARLLRLYGYYRIWQDRRVASRFDDFVVLTQEDLGYWGKMPNIKCIPNSRTFKGLETSDTSSHRVLAVGRYEYEKHFPELLHLWARLTPIYPGWTLEIVGDGPLRSRLTKLVEELNLQGSVLLSRSTNNIRPHYEHASIMLLTSEYEGLPMVLLEAQAMGLPIVAYACPTGPRDIVTDGKDGYLITPGDVDTFAKRLGELMSDAELRERMGNKALEQSERFSQERIMEMWKQLFNLAE